MAPSLCWTGESRLCALPVWGCVVTEHNLPNPSDQMRPSRGPAPTSPPPPPLRPDPLGGHTNPIPEPLCVLTAASQHSDGCRSAALKHTNGFMGTKEAKHCGPTGQRETASDGSETVGGTHPSPGPPSPRQTAWGGHRDPPPAPPSPSVTPTTALVRCRGPAACSPL